MNATHGAFRGRGGIRTAPVKGGGYGRSGFVMLKDCGLPDDAQWVAALRMVIRSAAAMVAVFPAGTATPASLPATRPSPATETLSRVVFAEYIIVSAARMMA